MSAIQIEIERLTAEWTELCSHYESEHTYLVPATPRRMREIQEALHAPGGLWERRRAEIAQGGALARPAAVESEARR